MEAQVPYITYFDIRLVAAGLRYHCKGLNCGYSIWRYLVGFSKTDNERAKQATERDT